MAMKLPLQHFDCWCGTVCHTVSGKQARLATTVVFVIIRGVTEKDRQTKRCYSNYGTNFEVFKILFKGRSAALSELIVNNNILQSKSLRNFHYYLLHAGATFMLRSQGQTIWARHRISLQSWISPIERRQILWFRHYRCRFFYPPRHFLMQFLEKHYFLRSRRECSECLWAIFTKQLLTIIVGWTHIMLTKVEVTQYSLYPVWPNYRLQILRKTDPTILTIWTWRAQFISQAGTNATAYPHTFVNSKNSSNTGKSGQNECSLHDCLLMVLVPGNLYLSVCACTNGFLVNSAVWCWITSAVCHQACYSVSKLAIFFVGNNALSANLSLAKKNLRRNIWQTNMPCKRKKKNTCLLAFVFLCFRPSDFLT